MTTREDREKVRAAIRDLLLQDRRKGEVQDLGRYKALFPGFWDVVAEEYRRPEEEAPVPWPGPFV